MTLNKCYSYTLIKLFINGSLHLLCALLNVKWSNRAIQGQAAIHSMETIILQVVCAPMHYDSYTFLIRSISIVSVPSETDAIHWLEAFTQCPSSELLGQ